MDSKSIGAESLVRHMSGPYADCLLSIFEDDTIVEFLTADVGRQHVWYAWISTRDENATLRTDSFNFLNYGKSEQLVADAFGSCPRGLLHVFGKLGVQACRKETYTDLFSLMSESSGRSKYLQHASAISTLDIEMLMLLAPEFCTPHILMELGSVMVAAAFMHTCTKVVERRPTLSFKSIEQTLRNKSRSDFYDILEGQALKGITFGPSPLTHSEKIRPTKTAKQLRKLGKKYENCLCVDHKYTKGVVKGRNYFYEWLEGDGAVVQVSYDFLLGWAIEEARGPKNKPLESEKVEQIAAALGVSAYINGGWGTDIKALVERGADHSQAWDVIWPDRHTGHRNERTNNDKRLLKEVRQSIQHHCVAEGTGQDGTSKAKSAA